MAGSTEIKVIEVVAYKTDDGKPTCSTDITNDQFCRFLGSQRMGTVDVCMCSGDLLWRDDGGAGFLRPTQNCPVWVG